MGAVEHVADDEADTVAVPVESMKRMVFGNDDETDTQKEAA